MIGGRDMDGDVLESWSWEGVMAMHAAGSDCSPFSGCSVDTSHMVELL